MEAADVKAPEQHPCSIKLQVSTVARRLLEALQTPGVFRVGQLKCFERLSGAELEITTTSQAKRFIGPSQKACLRKASKGCRLQAASHGLILRVQS